MFTTFKIYKNLLLPSNLLVSSRRGTALSIFDSYTKNTLLFATMVHCICSCFSNVI